MRQYYVWSMEFGRGFSRTGAVKAMNRAGLSRYRVFKFLNLLELPPYTLFLPTTFHSTTLHTHHDGSGVRLNEGSTPQAASKPDSEMVPAHYLSSLTPTHEDLQL